MKVLIMKGKRKFIEELNRMVSIVKPKNYFVEDESKDYHTQFGTIKKSEFKKAEGSVIKTEKGKELSMFSPEYIDLYMRIERSAQIIPLKDVGSIIASTGIGKDSRILDAGAGSGGLSLFLAHIAKEVISYELREDHYEIVQRNIEKLGLKNVKLKNTNIYEGIKHKNIDVITLDLPEPWKVIPHLEKALNIGGFVVVYNPSIIQIKDFVDRIDENDKFERIKIVEIIERYWEIKDRKVRPKTQGIGHSGFMLFCRRIQK